MPLNPLIPDRSNGQVINQTWFNLIKSNLEAFLTRIAALEGETQEFAFYCNQPLEHWSVALPKSGFITIPILANITLLNAYVRVYTAGTAGTLEIGWDFKRGGGAWTSVLSTNPSLAFGAGSLVTSSNGVVNNLYDELVTGDFLRMNLVQLQSATSPAFFKHWSAHLTFKRT